MTKKFYVTVNYGTRFRFPKWCPFSGVMNPEEQIVISTRKSLMLLPLPGHIVEYYRSGSISVPASAEVCKVVFYLKLANLSVLLGGIGFGFFYLPKGDEFLVISVFCLCALSVGIIFVLMKLRLRPVRLTYLGKNSMDICFSSEKYAQEFCALNGLQYEARVWKLRVV
jgi:hypothetical protein